LVTDSAKLFITGAAVACMSVTRAKLSVFVRRKDPLREYDQGVAGWSDTVTTLPLRVAPVAAIGD